jgi:hypothetical protein
MTDTEGETTSSETTADTGVLLDMNHEETPVECSADSTPSSICLARS